MARKLDLRPGSPTHDKLLQLVRSRRDFSARHMKSRHEKWREADRTLRLFVDPDKKTKDGKPEYPWARSIVVPLSYALVQTQLAFDVTAFTQRTPIIGLDGAGPEDVRAAKVMEQLLHWEWRVRRMILDLYTWLYDRRRYGLGILWNWWGRDISFRRERRKRQVRLPFLGEPIEVEEPEEVAPNVRYEGNMVQVVDPFTFWPDPRIPISRLQEGEFVGRTVRRPWSYMKEQAEPNGPYVNVDRIPLHKGSRLASSREGATSGRETDQLLGLSTLARQMGDSVDFLDHGYVELDEFIVKIVPKDYGIGSSSYPEKWWITVANDAVVVRAEPFGYEHDQYLAVPIEAHLDAHSTINPGNTEELEPLQTLVSWLFNSHIENVRKALNDCLVVNPFFIEWDDVTEPQPGRLMRIRREAYLLPNAVDQAAKQLMVQDVTRNHLTDMQAVIDMAQRVSAAPENLQGVVNPRERTLGEQQMVLASANNRLRVDVQLAWAQGMVPWAQQRVANLQSLMSEERFVKVVGEFPRALGVDPSYPFLRVTREDIQGQFQYDIIEGVIRTNEELLRTWKEIFVAVGQQPLLYERFDIAEIFRWIATLSGISNIDDFVRREGQIPPVAPGTVKVAPDEEVLREVEKGNLTPAEAAGGPL